MKKLLLNLFISLLSIVFVLLLAELAVRILKVQIIAGQTIYAPNIFYSYELKPNFSIPDYYGAPFATNDEGIREAHNYLKAEKKEKRVLVLGDSYTFGIGVKSEDTYSKQLENLLSELVVINAGIPGYTAWQETRYFQHKGYRYQPDLVIIGLVLNDLDPTRACDSQGNIYKSNRVLEVAEPPTIYDRFIDHSKLFKTVLSRFERLKEKIMPQMLLKNRDMAILRRSTPEKIRYYTAKFLADLYEQIRTKSQTEVLILLFPFGNQLNESDNYQQMIITEELNKSGFPVIDILPLFKEHTLKELYPIKDDLGHFGPLGHKIVSKAIYSWLVQNKPDLIN